ncbi:MAG: TetR family transcriptional regulator [Bacteroidota bacterium]
MSSKREKTEDKIKDAALRVFTTKGYDATTTRDIAKEADVNIASLHYYFRSKDKLFVEVTAETLTAFNKILETVLVGEEPLKFKIHRYVDQFMSIYQEHPELPAFIVMESARKDSALHQVLSFKDHTLVLEQQLQELMEKEEIRPISTLDFISNLVGLMVFPFLCKNIFEREFQMTDEDFTQMIENRKQTIPQMIINDLYIK